MLVADHAKYHAMNPSDIKWDGDKIGSIEFLRPTSSDGEQMSMAIPIFKDDTREQIVDRMNFMYSLVQDRIEDHNKAVLEGNNKAYSVTLERVESQIKSYEDKGQKAPKKLYDAQEKLKLAMTGIDEVLGHGAA